MALLKSTGNKKVNLDFNKEFINTFTDKIENGNIEFTSGSLYGKILLGRRTCSNDRGSEL